MNLKKFAIGDGAIGSFAGYEELPTVRCAPHAYRGMFTHIDLIGQRFGNLPANHKLRHRCVQLF